VFRKIFGNSWVAQQMAASQKETRLRGFNNNNNNNNNKR
jgi:hypothetical protein